MTKRTKRKILDVAKFGGVDDLGTVQMHGHEHEAKTIEAKSEQTHLEDDTGHGNPAVIRRFTFGVNPQAFHEHTPTTQELFNAHYKGIELALWKDGLKVIPEVDPRVVFNKQKTQYFIFVGARPMKGFLLNEKPQTLTDIVHGHSQ